MKISLIDLNQASWPDLVPCLISIFDNNDVHVQQHDFAEMRRSVEEPCSAVIHGILQSSPDLIFLILPLVITDRDRSLISRFSAESRRIPIIAVAEDAGTGDMLELFKLGVTDFITSPVKAADVMPRVWRLAEHARKKESLAERLREKIGLRQIIGSSPAFIAELRKIPLIAGSDSSVLISGETGTGKEMFARAIHYLGPRAGKPFTPVNCGAIPADLLENELFGHAKGAYTSAISSEQGIIQETDGGTLFLDEIDSLTLAAQVKILRFLQEKEYRQLGSAKTQRADVRIVAATNIDLDEAVNQTRFRRDLFYRLNVIPLYLPPLRSRREDIPLLAKHFIDQYSIAFNKEIEGLSPEAEKKLLLHVWPGNVRELQNVIERAAVFASGRALQGDDINLPKTEASSLPESFQQAKARVVIEFEKQYINDLLISHRGNITQAAKTAGKNRRAFWELMRKYEISNSVFKHSE